LKIVTFWELAVRVVSFVGRWCVVACVALLGGPALAQTVATPHSGTKPSGHVPTRMQRCESEVASLSGADRKRVLRECLVNRNEGERIVSRNCSRQFRDMPPGGTKIDKGVFMKQCVATGLKAGHDKLPARKPATPSSAAAAKPASAAASKPAPAKP
jgi:hypothetical protein